MKREMEAYLVLLHLVSQGWATFADMKKILGWEEPGFRQGHAKNIVAHINEKLIQLSEDWGEPIPRINAFLFRQDGNCTDYICENIFGCDDGLQPSPRQIAEYATAIATYENWQNVIKAFRDDAFESHQPQHSDTNTS